MSREVLVVRCEAHPTYRAEREPRADCGSCRALRALAQIEDVSLVVQPTHIIHHTIIFTSVCDVPQEVVGE